MGESQFRRLEKRLSTLPTLWRESPGRGVAPPSRLVGGGGGVGMCAGVGVGGGRLTIFFPAHKFPIINCTACVHHKFKRRKISHLVDMVPVIYLFLACSSLDLWHPNLLPPVIILTSGQPVYCPLKQGHFYMRIYLGFQDRLIATWPLCCQALLDRHNNTKLMP